MNINIRKIEKLYKKEDLYTNYQKFIILASQRFGSNYLSSLLRSHNEIIIFGEIFSKKYVFFENPEFFYINNKIYLRRRNKEPVKFLKDEIFKKYPKSISAVGFVIFYNQAKNKKLKKIWEYLKNYPDLKIIHLTRKNLLKSYLSLILASRTDRWIEIKNNKTPLFQNHNAKGVKNLYCLLNRIWLDKFKTKIRLSYKNCFNYFKDINQKMNYYDEYFKNKDVIEIYYEDLDKDNKKELKRAQDFLYLPLEKLTSNLIKQHKRPLYEYISNYYKLKDKYKNTKYSSFFEDLS